MMTLWRNKATWLIATFALVATMASPVWIADRSETRRVDDYERAVSLYRDQRIDDAAALLQALADEGIAREGEWSLLGWCRLRLAENGKAAEAFQQALVLNERAVEPLVGLGFVALRNGDSDAAKQRFQSAIDRTPRYAEAWKGLGLAHQQLNELKAAREAWQEAVRLEPSDRESQNFLQENLAQIVEERRPRPAVEGNSVTLTSRARNARFEVRADDRFEPFFVKGINLGTALPGKFPAEFPDDPALYREWFDLMSDAGINAVRLYTLHPPSLYTTLREHNAARPDRKLWLIQGAWTELPPDDNYDDPAFDGAFRAEIRRVIDALHGNLELPPRPGHANGRYVTDVSQDVLALALGREWEPFSVDAYNREHASRAPFKGRYITTTPRYPIESWLASVCEEAIAHSTEYYGVQYPVGYTSWPTLDPLEHPTEATVEEEMVFRNAAGEELYEEIKEYDNDLVQVDTKRMKESSRYHAGLYAIYHAYPYYPEFMVLDPDYAKVRDAEGISRYRGYLQDLKRHHGDQPVLIGEFGVPTSLVPFGDLQGRG